MCCVLGYVRGTRPAPERHAVLFEALVREGRVRGMHAFGLALEQGFQMVCKRWGQLDLEEAMGFVHHRLFRCEPSMIIAHWRYSTSGDHLDNRNNQPLEHGARALVFNGVLDMGTKEEMEARHGLSLPGYNDGYIPLMLLERGGTSALTEFLWVNGGSYAGLVLDSRGVSAFTNGDRPLWIAEHDGAHWFASTRDIMLRAGFPKGCMRPVPQMEEVTVS